MVKDIVEKLEQNFDNLPERMATTPSPGTKWKKEALLNTLREIPRIPIAGTETGVIRGLGEHIYQSPNFIDRTKTVCCTSAFCLLSILLNPISNKFSATNKANKVRWILDEFSGFEAHIA